MNASWQSRIRLGIALALVAAVLVVAVRWQPAQAQKGKGKMSPSSGPHYTVVHTEGHNLIVTDNYKNRLYFYSVDRDAPVGSDLKLRGTADLTQVGKPVIKPENVKLRK
jgi:hypothetical protein